MSGNTEITSLPTVSGSLALSMVLAIVSVNDAGQPLQAYGITVSDLVDLGLGVGIPLSQKGAANGVAPLGADSLLPLENTHPIIDIAGTLGQSLVLAGPLSGGPGAASLRRLEATDIAGLGNVATANFGNTTGTVADGGALTDETSRAETQEGILATAASAAASSAGQALGGVLTNASAAVTNGQTVTIPNSCATYFVNSASGTILGLTIIMPAGPLAGQSLEIIFNVSIIWCTIQPNTGQTMPNAPVLAPASPGGSIKFVYNGGVWQ